MAPKRGKSLIGAFLAVALTGLVVVGVTQAPASAAVSKTLNISCAQALTLPRPGCCRHSACRHSAFRSMSRTTARPAWSPIRLTAPAISFAFGVGLPDSLIGTAAAAGVHEVAVKQIVTDVTVTGPTTLTEIQGRPADTTLAVAPGATSTFGPFTSAITEIGGGGVVKFTTKQVSFQIVVAIPGVSLPPIGSRVARAST